MWYIQNVKDENSSKVALLSGVEYTIGRKDCSFPIVGDGSISRKHSSLSLTQSESNMHDPQGRSTLTLIDFSKCGTSVNGDMIAKNAPTSLKDGDYLVCGTQSSNKWVVKYEPLVVMASCLSKEEKQLVKLKLATLGSHLVNEWRRECTMLVMTRIKVTIKVICAVASCNLIVKPNYFDSLIDSIKAKTDPPDPKEFLPPLEEPSLESDKISFNSCPDRQTLFTGKTFIFLTQKQFNRLSEAVSLANGKPILMEEDSDDGGDGILVAPGSCVVEAVETAQLSANARDWIGHVKAVLAKRGLRLISDSELTLAILYRSTSSYCCPQLAQGGVGKLQSRPMPALDTQTQTQAMATQVEEQQSQMLVGGRPTRSSLQPEASPVRVRKRNNSRENVDTLASKYQKMETDGGACPVNGAGDRNRLELQPVSAPATKAGRGSAPLAEKPGAAAGASAMGGDSKNMAIAVIPECSESATAADLKRAGGSTKRLSTSDGSGSHRQAAKRIKVDAERQQGSLEGSIEVRRQNATTSKKISSGRLFELGYISATRPVEEQLDIKIEQKLNEEEVIDCGTKIEFISLMVKTPKPKQFSNNSNAIGSTKNFKKFKKTSYPGYQQLPLIIGGKDLEVYENNPNENTEAMFQAQNQNDSQEEKRNAIADTLFHYQPPKKRSGRK